MRKKIDFCGNYVINNPCEEKEPIKNRFMKHAFFAYRTTRLKFAKWKPLSEVEKHMFSLARLERLSHYSNKAVLCLDETKKPYFTLEKIDFIELIPKEAINDVAKGIKRMRVQHGKRSVFSCGGSSRVESYNAYFDGEAYMSLGTFPIRIDSRLSDYTSELHFRVINLSSSFYCLIVTAFINESLSSRCSDFVIEHMNNQPHIGGYERLRWYEFYKLGYGEQSGTGYKKQVFDSVIQDIAWHIWKYVKKYVKPACLKKIDKLCPYLCSVKTNICKEGNGRFWASIDVHPQFCDYDREGKYCVVWREKSPFFIFSDVANKDIGYSSLRYHMADYLSLTLVISRATADLRRMMPQYIKNVQAAKQDLKKMLKIKAELCTNTYYLLRCIQESDSFEVLDYEYCLQSLQENQKSHANSMLESCKERANTTTELIQGLIRLIQNNVDYKNEQHNYSMQRLSIVIAIISLVVAVISIVITVCLSDAAMTQINSWWEFVRQFFMTHLKG